MATRETPATLKWLRDEHDNPTQSWYRYCLKLTRTARDIPSRDATAYSAWVKAQDKHPLDAGVNWHIVPRGAPLFYKGNPYTDGVIYGHVATYWGWSKARGPLCWSNDVFIAGKINMVHPLWFLSHWGHSLLGWAGDINGVKVPLKMPGTGPSPVGAVSIHQVVNAAKLDPKRGQGAKTPGSGPDVRKVEEALVELGYLSADKVDGSYGSATITAYKKWQNYLGYTGNAANGIPGPVSLRRLGHRFDFRVVA